MNNSLFSEFAARFAAESTPSLVNSFNRQVGNRDWSSARAFHDKALIEELERRGIDLSAIYDGKSISFAHHVELQGNTLVTID